MDYINLTSFTDEARQKNVKGSDNNRSQSLWHAYADKKQNNYMPSYIATRYTTCSEKLGLLIF